MKNKNKLTRFFATLRMTSKRAAFTLTEVAEPRQYGSHQELSAMAKVEPDAGQYAPSPLEGEGWGEGFRKRAAFTLAEVLITLGVIGVVAAMTIPTLMKSYQTKIRDAQFKKVYSTFTQAIRSVEGDYGYPPQCAYGLGMSECYQFNKDLLKKLKIIKTCPKAVQTGCMPEYLGIDTAAKNQHQNDANYDEAYWQDYADRSCGGYSKSQIRTKTAYVLSDGTIFFLFSSGVPLFAVDVNGLAGPNKWGVDVHSFDIKYQNNKFVLVAETSCTLVESGGIPTESLVKKLYGQR